MEVLLGFVYDVIGIRTIRRERNLAKKAMMALGFLIIGFLLIVFLLAL